MTTEERQEDAALWREVFKRRLDAFEKKLEENSRMIAEIHNSTAELVEMLKAWQGTAKVFGWVSTPIVKIVTALAAATAIYTTWPKK
jgi:hypothetical protein